MLYDSHDALPSSCCLPAKIRRYWYGGVPSFVHNLGFHVVCGVGRLDVERDDFTRHQQVPNDTLSYGAAMVLAQGTSFEHRSDCPTLTVWRLEFSPSERDAEPTSLQQPTVGLFTIRVDGPSQSQQLHRTLLQHGTSESRSGLIVIPKNLCCCPDNELPIRILHCSRPECPKCWIMPSITVHSTARLLQLSIFSWRYIQQRLRRRTPQLLLSKFSPWIPACYSWIYDL